MKALILATLSHSGCLRSDCFTSRKSANEVFARVADEDILGLYGFDEFQRAVVALALVSAYCRGTARIFEGGKGYSFVKNSLGVGSFSIPSNTAKEVDGILKRVPVCLIWRMAASAFEMRFTSHLLSLQGLFPARQSL